MDVYLDQKPFATEARTLGQIIEAVRPAAESAGRMIVEVRVDGRTLEVDEVERCEAEAPAGEEVQLITADPRELAIVTLDEAAGVLEAARDHQKRAADLLTTDHTDRAHEPLADALEAWAQARQAVAHVAELFGLDAGGYRLAQGTSAHAVHDLVDRLSAVRDQVNAGDWIALSDTLAYELDEIAGRWIELIVQMKASIRTGEAAS